LARCDIVSDFRRSLEPGRQTLLQAVREQRDPPQRRYGAGGTCQLHQGLDGDPDEPPGGGEQQERDRELDQHGRGDAYGEVTRAVVQRHVEPRVTQQQGARDDHQEDDDLALIPGGPGDRGEPGQLGDVQPDPRGLPAPRREVPGQGQEEYRYPGGQPHGEYDHEQNDESSAPPDPGVEQRVREVYGGQGADQLIPLVRGHPA